MVPLQEPLKGTPKGSSKGPLKVSSKQAPLKDLGFRV